MSVALTVPSDLPTPLASIPTPTPPPPAPPRPARLLIPSLNLDAAVEDVGVDASGAMETPRNLWNVGWFSAGPAPGGPGDAVMDGHLGLPGSPLVFSGLAKLRVGDLIRVVGADGTTRDFSVTSTASWSATSHPSGLFDTAGDSRLSLITCAGAYLRSSQTYADRLVVEATFSRVNS